MAAHVLTALKEIQANIASEKFAPETLFQIVNSGLGYAIWPDQLDPDDWCALRRLCDTQDLPGLKARIDELVPIYTRKWEELGCPVMFSDWAFAVQDKRAGI